MPILVIVIGLPGTGKSTVANKIATKLKCPVVEEDKYKNKWMINNLGKKKFNWHVRFQHPLSTEVRKKLHQFVLSKLETVLKKNNTVVLEGTFFTDELREPLYSFCRAHSAELVFVETILPEDINIKWVQTNSRIWKRGILRRWKRKYEPLKIKHTQIDTSRDIDKQIDKFLKQIPILKRE